MRVFDMVEFLSSPDNTYFDEPPMTDTGEQCIRAFGLALTKCRGDIETVCIR